MTTPIFTPEAVIKYAETRLFDADVRPKDVRSISLHNGVLPERLETMLHQMSSSEIRRLKQPNEREPIYFQVADRSLHIPQYSGFSRRERYEKLIMEYLKHSSLKIEFRNVDVDGDPRRTNSAYENFSYDFIKGLFKFSGDLMDNIDRVIFGPLPAVSNHVAVVENRPNEYLPSQVFSVDGKKVLNLGYVFGDQAGTICMHMLREFEGLARKLGQKNRSIDLMMFGRVGGLLDSMQRHDLVFPTGIIDDRDIREGRTDVYEMQNVLAHASDRPPLNYNVPTVLDETVEDLERARDLGAICVEMETLEVVSNVNLARRRYKVLDISFGFAGFVSDTPLKQDSRNPGQRDTLANELDSDRGERAAVNVLLDYIRKH